VAGVFTLGGSSANAASSATITQAATYGAGERIVVVVRWAGDTLTCTVSDGSAFSQVGGYVADTSGNRMAMFERIGVSSSSPTITATFSSATTNREIAYFRGTGLDASAAQTGTGQNQDAVAATTDAVTSGNMTPSAQPNIVLGLTCTRFFAVSITQGTSFTSLGAVTGWDSLAGDTSLAEYRRTTSTSAVAATFTAGGAGDSFHTIAGVFGEAAGGTNTQKTMSDTLVLTDAALDPVRRVRQMSDTTVVTDGVVQWRRLKRVMDETLTLVDSVVKSLILAGSTTYTKVMSDTLVVADFAVQWLRRVRGQIDTVTLSDGDTYRTSIITGSESIDVSDGFVSWRRLTRLAQDNIDIIDGFSKTLGGAGIVYARVMSDTVTVIDDAGRRWRLRFAQLTDAVGLSDQVLDYLRVVRSLGDVVELSDGTVKVRRTIKSMDESIEVSDGVIATRYLDQISGTSFTFGSSGPPFRFGGM